MKSDGVFVALKYFIIVSLLFCNFCCTSVSIQNMSLLSVSFDFAKLTFSDFPKMHVFG